MLAKVFDRMAEIVRYVKSRRPINVLLYSLIAVLLTLAIRAVLREDAASLATLGTLICAFVLCIIYVGWTDKREKQIQTQVLEIKSAFGDDSRAFERAKDLYLSSEYYRKRALFNNVSSIAVLVVLVGFVAFIKPDATDFSSISDLRDDLRSLRNYDSKDSQNTIPEAIVSASKNYQLALNRQLDAEVAIASPTYKVVAGFISRISVIGVAIYLVTLLNSAYRYNNMTATRLRSRFLSTLRGDASMEEFIKFATIVSAEDIQYNINIEHPTKRIMSAVELITAFFNKAKAKEIENERVE